MRFVHLTDLHLVHPAVADPHLHSDTAANLARMVEVLQEMQPPPEFVVISGDLTNQGDVQSYELLRDSLSVLEMPVLFAMGNHDDRAGFRQVFPDYSPSRDADAPINSIRQCGDLRVIVLDSLVAGQASGRLAESQFALLQDAFEQSPEQPTLVVVHHPPFMQGQAAFGWEHMDKNSSKRLAQVLHGKNIVGMLCGHVHHNKTVQWHGIPVFINSGLHNTIDVTYSDGLAIRNVTGYGLCQWHDYGTSMVFLPLTPEQPITKTLPLSIVETFR